MINVGINGMGRIGRMALGLMLKDPNFRVVAGHDLADAKALAHLLKYDTVHGRLGNKVAVDGNCIVIDDEVRIPVIGGKVGPSQIDWGADIDLVIESTGVYSAKADPEKGKEGFDGHIGRNGCKKVILTVPPKGAIDATIVMGVNEADLKSEHLCVSNASCTTNCLAPIAKVLDDAFAIKSGWMLTVHSYTNDQVPCDQIHSDLRRARACAQNIIPTSTGAAKAIGLVLPRLDGKLDGNALRVPTADVSVVDLSVLTERPMTKEAINAAMAEAAAGPMKGILGYIDEPLVSSDFIGDPRSSIFDSLLTMVKADGYSAKVSAWYDNEYAYSCRVLDLAKLMFA